MKLRVAAVIVLLAALAFTVWGRQIFTVARPGGRAQALALREPLERLPVNLDVVLPAVPVGMQRLQAGEGPLLVHYWAPWERNARAQATALDSLRRAPELEGLRVVLVTFDPFPSVARFVARHRLRLAVLLDGRGELREVLPCPSVPYTWVIDSKGRAVVSQAGEIDWLAVPTRAVLEQVMAEQREPADSVRRPTSVAI